MRRLPESAPTIAGALLQLALVFLHWCFVMTDTTEVREDTCLGHRALEPPQC